jgi:tRNA A-37 threonylcarbamoyl transferase component Bud32
MQLFNEPGAPEYGIDGTPLNPERIRALNEIVNNLVGTNFEVVKKERLRSKKNVVYHVIVKPEGQLEVNFIAKAFVTENFEMEFGLLKQCTEGNLKVPEIIDARDGVLLLAFVDGELLVDRINRSFDAKLIDDLAQWYFDFHSLQPLLKGDPRLRNFIVGADGLYGIDFEEASKGPWIEDLGGIAASLLDTDPINDKRKQIMVWQLLDKYLELKGIERSMGIDKDYIEVLSSTLKQTARWRNSEVLSDLANQIEKDGLPK